MNSSKNRGCYLATTQNSAKLKRSKDLHTLPVLFYTLLTLLAASQALSSTASLDNTTMAAAAFATLRPVQKVRQKLCCFMLLGAYLIVGDFCASLHLWEAPKTQLPHVWSPGATALCPKAAGVIAVILDTAPCRWSKDRRCARELA